MEFKKSDFIQFNDNKFINFGYIDSKLAVIFSNFEINKPNIIIEDSQLVSKSGNNWNLKYKDENINLVFPCDKDLIDSSKSKYILLEESSQQYNETILPYIDKIYNDNIKWINDIINKKKEQNKIMYRDDKIIISKDILWDCNDIKTFYLLGFPIEKLKTIRDLRKKHIPLLKLIKSECIKIANQYNINSNQLYFFFHYHPSFYHLHLHCCIIGHKELTPKYFRCKMLETIILNLEKSSFYYRDSNILFEIPDNHIISKLLLKN